MSDVLRRAALAVAVVDLVAVASLVTFFAVGGPFGMVNDVANAVLGVASAALAWLHRRAAKPAGPGWPAVAAAAVGGALMMLGSVLVVSGRTGWYLAGLVSAVGAAWLGGWLASASRASRVPSTYAAADRDAVPGPDHSRLGRAAGLTMMLGLLAVPGVLTGMDDWSAAPWYVGVAQLSWLGTYALYPFWCVRLARASQAQVMTYAGW